MTLNHPGLISLLVLTLLLSIGLFFFIKASVKDRTEELTLMTNATEDELLPSIRDYFDERAYRLAGLDRATQLITFEGVVRPSWFLTIFLSSLAALGLLCTEFVVFTLWPGFPPLLWMGVLLAPTAGWFYWKGAGRTEQVQLQVQSLECSDNSNTTMQSIIAVRAHRDELAELQKTLSSRFVVSDAL